MLPPLHALLLGAAVAIAGPEDSGTKVGGSKEGGPTPVQVAPTLPSPQARLEFAINAYIQGDLITARDTLVLLVTDPEVTDPALLREARLWLGEIQYTLGELQAAEKTYQAVLLREPELRLDPYKYPPEVIAFFDAVRAALEAQTPPPNPQGAVVTPGPPPRPGALLIATPGGLQLHNGQRGLGVLTLTSVGALGLGSLGMRLWLLSLDEDPQTRGVQMEVPIDQVEAMEVRLNTIRAVENTLGFTALGVWGAAVLQGALRMETQLGPTPAELQVGPGGAALTIRF